MKKEDELIIAHIIASLNNFALNDIKKIIAADKRTLLASFILCSCFIEQVSGFRYAKVEHKTGKDMFKSFIKEYMPSAYDPIKLREDLRNKLVHNYSLGSTYSLVEKMPDIHLKPLGNRIVINIENFVAELEEAFNKYVAHLKSDVTLQANAIKQFGVYRIIGSDNHDFLTFEQAQEIVNSNIQFIKGFSETEKWPLYLISLLIVPSGCEFETMVKLAEYRIKHKCGNKEALIGLSLFDDTTFDVYIVGSTSNNPNEQLQIGFIKHSDYLVWTGNAL